MAERTQRTKKSKDRSNPLTNAIVGREAFNSLPSTTELSNVFQLGAPPDAVASTVLPDGSAGFILSDGSTVAADGISSYGPIAADIGGAAVAGYNAFDAGSNILKGSRRGKGTVEGLGTLAGTAGGYILGGLPGAGIGSVIGRTAGRGLASVGESLGVIGGRSTKEYQADRTKDLLRMGYTPDQLKLRTGTATTHPGQKANWDTTDKSNPLNMMGSEGMLKYGPEYLNKLSHQDRYLLTKYAIDKGYFQSNKGDEVIGGDEMADIKANQDSILKNPDYLAQFNARNETFSPLSQDPTKMQQTSGTTSDGQAFTSVQPGLVPGRGPQAVGPDGVLRGVAPGTNGTAPAAPEGGKEMIGKLLPQLMGMAQPSGGIRNAIPEMPQEPTLKTPEDFTNAYIGIYERNSGNQVFNPLSRRF